MALLLRPGGRLYLSTPIGRDRVEFNANRVFDPRDISRLAGNHRLTLQKLTVIGCSGDVRDVQITSETMQTLAEATYNLGIFVFTKA